MRLVTAATEEAEEGGVEVSQGEIGGIESSPTGVTIESGRITLLLPSREEG